MKSCPSPRFPHPSFVPPPRASTRTPLSLAQRSTAETPSVVSGIAIRAGIPPSAASPTADARTAAIASNALQRGATRVCDEENVDIRRFAPLPRAPADEACTRPAYLRTAAGEGRAFLGSTDVEDRTRSAPVASCLGQVRRTS